MPNLDVSTGRTVAAPKPRAKLKPRATQTFERPAPALRNSSAPPPTRKRLAGSAMKTRQLTSRQTRLNEQYGAQFHAKTGRSLRGERGLMRALLEENLASASDLQHTLQAPGQTDFQHGHKLHGGLDTLGHPSIVDNTDYGTLGTSMTRPHNTSTFGSDPYAMQEFAARVARQVHLPPIDAVMASGGERGQPGLAGHPAPNQGDPDQLAFQVLDELRSQGVDETTRDAVVNQINAHNPGWAKSLYRASMAHAMIDDPSARETKFKEQSASDPGDISKAILLATGAGGLVKAGATAAAKAVGFKGLGTLTRLAAAEGTGTAARIAAGAAARAVPGAAARGTLAAGKAVLRPGRTIGMIAKRGPIARIGAGAGVLSAPVALHEAGYRLQNYHGLSPTDLEGMNPLGVAAAQAAARNGGELSQQEADQFRQPGTNGVLITDTYTRNRLLAKAQQNGWQDNEHTDDLTIIQHSMLGAPSGARRFLGNAFHGAAVLADVPAGFQALGGAGLQSIQQHSARPALQAVEQGFVNPTLNVLEHPVQAFQENPVLAATVGIGALRGAGGALGRITPMGEGIRTVNLPGQGDVVLGAKSRNLVDRGVQSARDRFLSSHDANGNPIQQLAHNRAVALQTRQGQQFVTLARHRADVAAQERVHVAEKRFLSLHPDVAAGVNEVLMHYGDHATREGYLAEFDRKIQGARDALAQTQARLDATVKAGENAGASKLNPEGKTALQLKEDLKTQAALVERYQHLREAFVKHAPKNVRKITDLRHALGDVEEANIPDIVKSAGGDPALAGKLELRRYSESAAHDTALLEAIRNEKQAATRAHVAATKAHNADTRQAHEAAAGAQQAHADAVAHLEHVRASVESAAATPTGAAAPAEAQLPGSARLHEILAREGTAPKARAGRSQANQAVVDAASQRIGHEFVTADGEHGIVVGINIVGRARRKRAVFHVRIIAKDGTIRPASLQGAELNQGVRRFQNATGTAEKVQTHSAGFTPAGTVEVHHPDQAAVYGEHASQPAPVRWVKERGAGGDGRIGVAKTLNRTNDLGRPARGGGGYREGYHVVVEMPNGTAFAPKGLEFTSATDANRFAHEAAARPGNVVESVKAQLQHATHQASMTEGERFLAEQPATVEQPHAEPAPQVETRVLSHEQIKESRGRLAKYRRQIERLRAEAGKGVAAGAAHEQTISRPLIEAIIAREHSKSAALIEELKKVGGKSPTPKVALDPKHIPALRAELVRLAKLKATDAKGRGRVAAAKKALEKLPASTSAVGRSVATGTGKSAKADALARRADALEAALNRAETALKDAERHASGERAAQGRGQIIAGAEARLEAATKNVQKTEERLAAVLGKEAPTREGLRAQHAAIETTHLTAHAEQMRAQGARPAFRPHVAAEEGTRSPFPAGGKNRVFRTEFRDVFGRNRLEQKNTMTNIRRGVVKPDVSLTLRALRAPLQARELAEGGDALVRAWGTELPNLGPGGTPTVGLATDFRRDLGDLYSQVEHGGGANLATHADGSPITSIGADGKQRQITAAEALFDGVFQVENDPSVRRLVPHDQVVVKTSDGQYFALPAEAVDQLRGWFADTLERYNRPGALHAFTKAWRTQALNTTPTTPINNFIGGLGLAVTGGAGPISMFHAGRAIRGKGNYAGVVPAEMFGSGLAGTTTGVIRPGAKVLGGRNVISRAGRGYLNFNRNANIMAEDFGRVALWIHHATKEARRAEYGPVLSKIRGANDAVMAQLHDGNHVDFAKVHGIVNDFMGDLYKRGKHDRKLFLAIPFHRWFGHMVKLSLVTMPIHYPKRAAFLQELGQMGEDYRKEHGVFPDWMRGAILMGTEHIGPWAGYHGELGLPANVAENTISTTGANPYASTSQFLGGPVGGGFNPVLIAAASWITGKHIGDIGDATQTLFSGESGAQIRDFKDYQGNVIHVGDREWFRAGAHELAGMIPILTKAFPSSGRDDAYIPGFDDTILGHRLGMDRSRTYHGPQPEGGILPPWLEPAETPRHTGHLGPIPVPTSTIGRFFALRTTPYYVGGPAFNISAQKTIGVAQQQASHAGKSGHFQRTPNPVKP